MEFCAVCFGSGSVARGKRAGFNLLHASRMTHLLQWSVFGLPIVASQTTPADLKQQVFYYFSGFCGLAGVPLDGSSNGLTWSLPYSCIQMAAMVGHPR